MCWLVTTGYTFLLIPWYFFKIYQLYKNENYKPLGIKLFYNIKLLFGKEEKRLAKLTLILSVIWFISGYSWYISLAHTSVTANTIISNSAFIWTLILSVFLLQEKLSSLKIACCFFCLCGLIIVTFAGNHSEEDGVDQTTLGFILICFSTILNAAYDVFYKRFAPSSDNKNRENESISSPSIQENDEIDAPQIDDFIQDCDEEDPNNSEVEQEQEKESVDIPRVDQEVPFFDSCLFLGFTGFFVAIIFWPGIPILNWLGIEEFEVPSESTSFLLFLNVILDGASTLGTFAAISWTSPMFTDIALLLTIPTSVIFDVIIHDYILPYYGWIGVTMLIIGFLCLLIADLLIDYRLKLQEQDRNLPKWLDNILCCSSTFYAFT